MTRWPKFETSQGKGRGSEKHLVLDVPIRKDKRLREAACDFWEPYFLGSLTGSVPASQQ